MSAGDSFEDAQTGVADTGTIVIDPTDGETGAIELREFYGGAQAEIYKEVDVDGDGTYEITTRIDDGSLSGEWYSENNEVLISDTQGSRAKIKNVSGSSTYLGAAGVEVPD